MTMNVSPNQKGYDRQALVSDLFTNISTGWKMTLIVAVLFLGILGITLSGYSGLQSLRYQLSNIYDFMLVPIIAINNADAALADAQYSILQSHNTDLSAAERTQYAEDIPSENQKAEEVVTRYDTEWVTTASPDFTRDLRNAGKLALQEQEVSVLAEYHTAYDAYQASLEKYLATVQSGKPSSSLANATIEDLTTARSNLQELIVINNQYAEFSNELAQNAFRRALVNGGIVLVLSAVIGLFLSYLISISITSRLGDLIRSANAMQEGNLDQSVGVVGRDEVSRLGTAFNTMASQLKDTFATLEQRVTARTKDLEIVAEVGTATSTILDTKSLLQGVVDLTKERFNLYHSHIYLLDEAHENLVLASGAGEPGRQMVAEGRSIPLNREQSLVARAAREQKGVTVNDVTKESDFLPNPLLPDTHSELAVPMIVGGRVIGVFDVQSELVGRFTDSDINIQTTLAAQIATSIQNVRSFEQSRKQADLESLVNTIGQKIQRATTVEDTLQTAIRELGMALGASRVKASISAQKDGSNN